MRKGLQKIYSEVARRYELVNHVLTFGLDMLWRKKASLEAVKAKGLLWLDVCSGTGEMALYLSRLAGDQTKIISVDFSYHMFSRAAKKTYWKNVFFILSKAGRLPFPDNTFDLITISFATRNIYPNLRTLNVHLREFHRVLKHGGRFVNLETSQPPVRAVQKLFHCYVKLAVKPIGVLFSGSKAGYRYLAFTIPRFLPPEQFSSILREVGFSCVHHHLLFLGVSAIHVAVK